MAALDIDTRQVNTVRRIDQQVPQATDFVGDDGVTKAIGGALKLFGDPCVYRGIIAVVRVNRVLAQQMRQELAIGDVDHLTGGDGFGHLVQLVAAPVRMFLVQLIPDNCARAQTAAAATACISADIAASRVMAYPRSVDFRGFSLMIVQNQGVVVGATVDQKMRPTTGPSISPRRTS
jgi:hypothetical protein